MVNFIIEETDEKIFDQSGLTLIDQLLNQTQLDARLNAIPVKGIQGPCLASQSDVSRSYLGLLCQGKSDFEDIEDFRERLAFTLSLNIGHVPSSPRLRQRLELAAKAKKWETVIKEESASLIRQHSHLLTPILMDDRQAYMPVDMDVSPYDNSDTQKEGIGWTYKGFDGYAPMFAYMGLEGFLINTELRHGETHCQKGTPAFLQETLRRAKEIVGDLPLLIRMDSGNDSADNVNLYPTDGSVNFIVKRNPRKEKSEDWLAFAKENGTPHFIREGKIIYKGSYWVKPNKYENKVRLIYEVTERTIDAEGQVRLIPDISFDTYYTRLWQDPDQIIDLYHDHGTMEQYHSEFKTELDIERMPSGDFETNSLIQMLGLLAYNLLRVIGQESLQADDHPPLRKRVHRRRLRTVIQNMITIATKFVFHAKHWRLKVNRNHSWLPTFRRLYATFSPT